MNILTKNPQAYRCAHYRALKAARLRAEATGDVEAAHRIAIALRQARAEQTNSTEAQS
jgi:hypothetical protein